MKFLISFLASLNLYASPIEVFYEEEPSRAELVKNIFTEQYQIPEDLIGITEVKDCDRIRKKGKLELCLKNNGDLIVVSVDRSFISESLKIFQAP